MEGTCPISGRTIMSTIPGDDADRDAGLHGPDVAEPLSLAEALDIDKSDDTGAQPQDPEDHKPGPARPDQEGEADEADVLEQLAAEPIDEDDGL